MVSSLLARRVMFSGLTALAARTTGPAAFTISARRTLYATPQFNLPAKATKGKPATAAKRGRPPKTGATKATRAKPAKRGRPLKEKPPKEEKPRSRVPKDLKPPKQAPGPYSLFISSFFKTHPKPNTFEECHELFRRAGQTWSGYSMAEKQPFYDESEARKVQAKEEREEFLSNTSSSNLKLLNTIRKAQGKPRLRQTRKNVPPSAFLIFANEFRNSPEGMAAIDEESPEKSYPVRSVLAAAQRWRSLTDVDKAVYFERFKEAKEELKAKNAETST